jgi:hypothetical protein
VSAVPVRPDVTAVIPSSGRASLLAAVESARTQQDVTVEVVVVLDAPADRAVDPRVQAAADLVLHTGGGRGAAVARNLGTRAARGRWVAYLDDDDTWLPGKLRTQLAAVPGHADGRPVLVSSQVRLAWDGRPAGGPVPARTIAPGQRVEDYLFRRRGLEPSRNALFSSTLLTDRATALAVPWDESLARHQDWDWAVRVARRPRALVIQVPQVLGLQHVGSAGSMSAGDQWRVTLHWGRSQRRAWDRRVHADFAAGQVLRFALQARSARGVASACREMLTSAPPSPRSLLLGLSAAVPRHRLEAVARAVAARQGARTAVEPVVPAPAPAVAAASVPAVASSPAASTPVTAAAVPATSGLST